ncbi:MAG: hypothetical protein WDN48_18300 [Pseudolabrys sp.]
MSSDPMLKAAVAHWGPRFVANGVVLTDFEEVTGAMTSYATGAKAGRRAPRITSNSAAMRWPSSISSPPANACKRAAVYYHFASFLFVQDQAQMKAAHLKQIECRQLALPGICGRRANASRFPTKARRSPAFAQALRRRHAAGGGDGGRARFDQGRRRRL